MRLVFSFLLIFFVMSCAFEDPNFITIEAHGPNCSLEVDGFNTEISELPIAIQLKTQGLDSLQKSRFYVKLNFSEETNMGTVSDIKQELRKLNVLNVKYYSVKPKKCPPI